MIISHKHKFIFLKTYKTAGTSIEAYLSQYCGEEDVLTPLRPQVPPHRARNHRGFWNIIPDLGEILRSGEDATVRRSLGVVKRLLHRLKFEPHMKGSLVKRRISRDVWESYFKFCVERNPWDKTVSHYYMIKARSGANFTLEDYFERKAFCVNYPIYTAGTESLVDEVIRYENLSAELGEVFQRLGIPFDGSLGVRAKSGHREVDSYRDLLSKKQAGVIKKAFQREIDMHGYTY